MTVGGFPVKKQDVSLDRVLALKAKSDSRVRVRQLTLRNVHISYTNDLQKANNICLVLNHN